MRDEEKKISSLLQWPSNSAHVNFSKKMHKIFFKFLVFILLNVTVCVRASNEPLMDILNNLDHDTKVSKLCDQHLRVLKFAIENDEIWALKGDDPQSKIKKKCCARLFLNTNYFIFLYKRIRRVKKT